MTTVVFANAVIPVLLRVPASWAPETSSGNVPIKTVPALGSVYFGNVSIDRNLSA